MAVRDVVLVIFPELQGLDLIGPVEVFAAANDEAPRPAYRLRIAAREAGSVTTSSGVTVVAEEAIVQVTGPIDTLVVVGGEGTHHDVHESLRRIAAACQKDDAGRRFAKRLCSCRLRWSGHAAYSRSIPILRAVTLSARHRARRAPDDTHR